MNLLHLKYAVEVERTRSFTGAAANLFMSQPNLSRAIKELEESLGITIFKRTSKGIVTTTQGEEFLFQAKNILRQIDEIEEQYRKDTADQKKMIVASTASPYKFAADVYRSITEKEASADTGALQDLSALTNTDITPPLCGLSEKPVRFDRTIDPAEMLEEVYRFM